MQTKFIDSYVGLVRWAVANDYEDNHDANRFGPETGRPALLARWLRRLALKLGLIPVTEVEIALRASLDLLRDNTDNLQWLYTQLKDDQSRRLLIQLAAFRALGHRKIKLPLNCPRHWSALKRAAELAERGERLSINFNSWSLSRMDLREWGYPLTIYTTAPAVVTQFVEEQYRCVVGETAIEAERGDFVIDAGGCWGDTALYFAHRVGETGQVLSCEFLEDNLTVYRENLRLNPELASRIKIVEKALWSESGDRLTFSPNGPGTSVAAGAMEASCSIATITIDDLVTLNTWPRVDFIKMDIEGAELRALQGAKQILCRYRPKLAVTVYHRFSDFWTIPQFLDSLGLGYRFYLRHFKIHAEETVLFARAD
jgi:FkbM family methyltransferase